MKLSSLLSLSLAIAIGGCALRIQPLQAVVGEVVLKGPDKTDSLDYADGTSWTIVHATVKRKLIYALLTWHPNVLVRFGNCIGQPLQLDDGYSASEAIINIDRLRKGLIYIRGVSIRDVIKLEKNELDDILMGYSDDVPLAIYVRTSDLSSLQTICMQFYGAAMFGPRIKSDVVPVRR